MHGLQPRPLHYPDWIAKVNKQLQNYSESKIIPVIYFEKCEFEFFEYYTYYHFSLEAVLQGMAKNNPTENKSKQKLKSDIKACAMKTDRRENVKVYRYITRIERHKLQLLIRICFFWTSVISDFEHVFVSWKRCSTKTIVVLILKYLTKQTNTYSKSAAVTLKQEVKSGKS